MKGGTYIFIAAVYGLIWTTLSGDFAYLLTAIFFTSIFILLPFVFPFFNLLLAFLGSFIIWPAIIRIALGITPSAKFMLHIGLYLVILVFIFYLSKFYIYEKSQ